MFTGILVTDGGPHSVDDWAAASAAAFVRAFEVKPDSAQYGQIEQAKTRLQRKVEDILLVHHQAVQDAERKILASGDHSRLNEQLDAAEHTDVEKAVADVRAACAPLLSILQSTSVISTLTGQAAESLTFEDHLMAVIRDRINMDFRTSMHIERSWHADRNGDTEHAKAFKSGLGKRGDDHRPATVDGAHVDDAKPTPVPVPASTAAPTDGASA